MFFIVFVTAILIGCYILSSLAVLRVLRIYDYYNTWMAWIPLLNLYALGDAMSDGRQTIPLFEKELPSALFLFWWVIAWLVGYIPFVGWIAGSVVRVLFFGTVFAEIYAKVERKPIEQVRVLGFLSGFIPLIGIIKFLCYPKDLVFVR